MNSLSKVLLKSLSIVNRPSIIKYPKMRMERAPSSTTSITMEREPSSTSLMAMERIPVTQTSNTYSMPTVSIVPSEQSEDITNVYQKAVCDSIFKRADLTVQKGLPNMGNTCFIASVIQASMLFQEAAFEEKLKNANANEKDTIASILEWIQLFKNAKTKTFDLTGICNLLRKHNQYNGSQEDAEELLSWFAKFQPTPSVYYHEIKNFDLREGESIIEDSEREPDARNYVRMIPLAVDEDTSTSQIKPGQTLLNLLKNYFSDIDVRSEKSHLPRLVQTSDQQYVNRNVLVLSKREILSAAPSELTIQIKKFREGTRLSGKLSDVPETFVMPKEYCQNGETATYRLRSVISHHGSSSIHRGHYTACVRKGDSFFKADDATITPIDQKTMLEAAKEGYILIYDKVAQMSQ